MSINDEMIAAKAKNRIEGTT